MLVETEFQSTAALAAVIRAPAAFRAWNLTGCINEEPGVFIANHDWLDTGIMSRTFSQGDPMNTAPAVSTEDQDFFAFRPRDTYPPILPSDILGRWATAWGDGKTGFLASPDLRTYFFDPAFHPATTEELRTWVTAEVSKVVQSRLQIRDSQQVRQTVLLDCEDSAFCLKSAAAGYVRSKLSAPLCAGVMACQTVKTRRDHVVNWFLSADPMPGGRPGYRHELWFADVRTAVEAQVRAHGSRGRAPAKGALWELEQPFVSLEVAVRCLTKPYLIFA